LPALTVTVIGLAGSIAVFSELAASELL